MWHTCNATEHTITEQSKKKTDTNVWHTCNATEHTITEQSKKKTDTNVWHTCNATEHTITEQSKKKTDTNVWHTCNDAYKNQQEIKISGEKDKNMMQITYTRVEKNGTGLQVVRQWIQGKTQNVATKLPFPFHTTMASYLLWLGWTLRGFCERLSRIHKNVNQLHTVHAAFRKNKNVT